MAARNGARSKARQRGSCQGTKRSAGRNCGAEAGEDRVRRAVTVAARADCSGVSPNEPHRHWLEPKKWRRQRQDPLQGCECELCRPFVKAMRARRADSGGQPFAAVGVVCAQRHNVIALTYSGLLFASQYSVTFSYVSPAVLPSPVSHSSQGFADVFRDPLLVRLIDCRTHSPFVRSWKHGKCLSPAVFEGHSDEPSAYRSGPSEAGDTAIESSIA